MGAASCQSAGLDRVMLQTQVESVLWLRKRMQKHCAGNVNRRAMHAVRKRHLHGL